MTEKRHSGLARWWHSLSARLVLMMSLALLPVGLIAVYQAREVTQRAQRNAELALLALMEQVALEERLEIQRAQGAVRALGNFVPSMLDDPEGCSRAMAKLVEESKIYSFAGFVPVSRQVTCSSAAGPVDVSGSQLAQRLIDLKEPLVVLNAKPLVSRSLVINASFPVFDPAGRYLGYASISIPHSRIEPQGADFPRNALVELATFDAAGHIFTSYAEGTAVTAELPEGLQLTSVQGERAEGFTLRNRNGAWRIYTMVPIVEGELFVLGVWDAEMALYDQIGFRVSPGLFPALMWLTSLVVVLLAVHRLVLRHVRGLRRQMLRFARDRALVETNDRDDMPSELREIQETFSAMAYSILRDEAQLENAVHEKNVLIREIHHRVKNNLQLISSIVNMQIRETWSDEAKSALRRVQDRVVSLATIHRDLYQSADAGRVNVGSLVREIVQKSVEIGAENANSIDLKMDIEDIQLFPDQAVPLSLLTAEAATNAMKYASAPEGEAVWVAVSMRETPDHRCVLRYANSVAGKVERESTGMGTRLIQAFTIQVGGMIEVEDTDDQYAIVVKFDITRQAPEAGVY